MGMGRWWENQTFLVIVKQHCLNLHWNGLQWNGIDEITCILLTTVYLQGLGWYLYRKAFASSFGAISVCSELFLSV